jgi:hypothetical protein
MPGKTTLAANQVRIVNLGFYGSAKSGRIGVLLDDGRMVIVPLMLYPSLQSAKPAKRRNWRLVGRGVGVHWPDLDLDLSAEGLVAARPESTRTARQQFCPDAATQYVIQILASSPNGLTVSQLAKRLGSINPESLQKLRKVLHKSVSSLPRASKAS